MTKKEVKCMKKINKVIKIINIISVILVILMFCNLIVTCFLPSDTKDYFEKQIIESSKFDVTFLFICQITLIFYFWRSHHEIAEKAKISCYTLLPDRF
jgi:hypothetical protein